MFSKMDVLGQVGIFLTPCILLLILRPGVFVSGGGGGEVSEDFYNCFWGPWKHNIQHSNEL